MNACNTTLVAYSQASVQTLREQVRLLRSQRQRAVVLAHLPQLRPEAQPQLRGAPSKCAALEVVRRLQLEPAQTPKVADISQHAPQLVLLHWSYTAASASGEMLLGTGADCGLCKYTATSDLMTQPCYCHFCFVSTQPSQVCCNAADASANGMYSSSVDTAH